MGNGRCSGVRMYDRIMDDYRLFLVGDSEGVCVRESTGGRVVRDPRKTRDLLDIERRFAVLLTRWVGKGTMMPSNDIIPHGLWWCIYRAACLDGLPVPAFVRRRVALEGARRVFARTP